MIWKKERSAWDEMLRQFLRVHNLPSFQIASIWIKHHKDSILASTYIGRDRQHECQLFWFEFKWASLIQMKILTEQRVISSEKEEILPAERLSTWTTTVPQVSSMPVHPVRFWIHQASIIVWANFKNKSVRI